MYISRQWHSQHDVVYKPMEIVVSELYYKVYFMDLCIGTMPRMFSCCSVFLLRSGLYFQEPNSSYCMLFTNQSKQWYLNYVTKFILWIFVLVLRPECSVAALTFCFDQAYISKNLIHLTVNSLLRTLCKPTVSSPVISLRCFQSERSVLRRL